MLSNSLLSVSTATHQSTTRSFDSESKFGFRHFIDEVMHDIRCSEVLVITSLPRSGLQIVQPQRLVENFEKLYARTWFAHDDASWMAISTGLPSRGNSAGRFHDEFLKIFGFEYSIASPIKDPVLPGYRGVLQLLRTADQGPFTDKELHRLGELSEQLSGSLADNHLDRKTGLSKFNRDRQPNADRLFVLDAVGKALLGKTTFNDLESNIRDQIIRETPRQISQLSGEPTTTNRLLLPDSKGDNWTFNAVAYAEFPALNNGPVVFFCLLPSCSDWGHLHPTDIQADSEMARMVPALRFMQQEYNRGPTLTEIAKTVHLSPFHFHRRFSELFGLTPKHFLLECQLYDAKSELLAGEKELAKIASDCGFAHQSHFTSRFKQATGLTPTRWRRMASSKQ